MPLGGFGQEPAMIANVRFHIDKRHYTAGTGEEKSPVGQRLEYYGTTILRVLVTRY
jgi:hypothetical protein